MSRMCMPLLVLNMGCEMIYILDQRLKAQNVALSSANTVLNDLVKTFFSTEFVDKLFIPKEVYSNEETRKTFNRLAECSIMKLNESSMDKLYDLMVMTFKYQVVCAPRLDELLKVTSIHLQSIRQMVKSVVDGTTDALIDRTEKLVTEMYGVMTVGQLHLIRQTLLSFLQGRKIKVSVLLEEEIQNKENGAFRIPRPYSFGLGVVNHYDDDEKKFETDKLLSRLTGHVYGDGTFFDHPAPMGSNLYDKQTLRSYKRPSGIDPTRHPLASDSLPKPEPTHSAVMAYPHNEALDWV